MKNKKEEIIEIISKEIRIDKSLISEESVMEDFPKWDSLAHLNLMEVLEKKFNKKIRTSKIEELKSVKKISKFLK